MVILENDFLFVLFNKIYSFFKKFCIDFILSCFVMDDFFWVLDEVEIIIIFEIYF